MEVVVAAKKGCHPPHMRAYTALVVVLLEPLGATAERRYQALQQIRHAHDAAYTRWLPHLTLIPPYQLHVPDEDPEPLATVSRSLDALAQALMPVCAKHMAHELNLSELHSFRLRRYHNIHLRPTRASGAPLVTLQRELSVAASSHIPRSARRREGFVPHASLGQSYSPEDTAHIQEEARRWLACRLPSEPAQLDEGLRVSIRQIQLMYKTSQQKGPYTLWRELSLSR